MSFNRIITNNSLRLIIVIVACCLFSFSSFAKSSYTEREIVEKIFTSASKEETLNQMMVLLQATLTFIGLGGESIWGTMLSDGRNWVLGPGGNLLSYWWVFLPPTLAVMLFGIAWNMFGDSLAESLSPAAYVGTVGPSFWSRFRKKSSSPEEVKEGPVPALLQPGTLPAWQEALQANPAEKPFPTPAIDPILVAARANARQGELSKALHAYGYLIRRGRLVNQLLPDLAQLVQIYPRDPLVWQTLGDALASTGDLEHANQSYAQARKYAS
jgi:hypothetical protein